MYVFLVYIWQTSLAARHVPQGISVTLTVLALQLDFARQDFTVQVETLKLQVNKRKIIILSHIKKNDFCPIAKQNLNTNKHWKTERVDNAWRESIRNSW